MTQPLQDDGERRQAEKLLASVAPAAPAARPLPERSQVHRVPTARPDVAATATALARWYEQKRMAVQVLETDGVYSVQCRTASWRRAMGMAVALTVVLHQEGDDLLVEIGSAPWAERAGVALVGTQLPILLGTAAVGAWEQMRLPDQTVRYIRSIVPPDSARPGTGKPSVGERTGGTGRRLRGAWQRGTAQLREATAAARAPATTERQPRSPGTDPAPPGTAAAGAGRLDLNEATEAQLSGLGLDSDTVSAIRRARESRGGAFVSQEDFERSVRLKPHAIVRLRELVVGPVPIRDEPAQADTGPSADRRRVVDL